MRTLPEPLLGWYRENARDLPWRHTEDPYRIWVSEIMLQQTRVAAVLGYYARFLAVFPTVEALAEVMPEEPADIRIFNQAMMELGATVCGPNTAPRCDDCPVSGLCLGRQRETAETLPVKKAKKERRVEEKTVLLLKRDRKIALRKRPKTGLLAGLWEFPNVEGALDETAAGAAVEAMGLSVIDWQSRLTAKHIFTHVEWRMTGYALTVRGDGPAELEWVDAAGLAARSVPSAFARYYEEAKRELEMK